MNENIQRKGVIGILILLIIILTGMVIYAYIVTPIINKYVIKVYNQGANDVLNTIFIQIQQKGFTQISSGNQTLTLVPYKSKNK